MTTPLTRVVLADDHTLVLEGFRRLLETHCELLATAGDGQALLQAVTQHRPDIVILDIGLPGMSGYEVGRRIREQDWGRSVVLVAQTGWGQEEDRQRTQEAGFDAHLVKPVDASALLALIARLRAERA